MTWWPAWPPGAWWCLLGGGQWGGDDVYIGYSGAQQPSAVRFGWDSSQPRPLSCLDRTRHSGNTQAGSTLHGLSSGCSGPWSSSLHVLFTTALRACCLCLLLPRSASECSGDRVPATVPALRPGNGESVSGGTLSLGEWQGPIRWPQAQKDPGKRPVGQRPGGSHGTPDLRRGLTAEVGREIRCLLGPGHFTSQFVISSGFILSKAASGKLCERSKTSSKNIPS